MSGEEAIGSDEEREIERQEEEEDDAAYEQEFGAQDVGKSSCRIERFSADTNRSAARGTDE